MHPLQNVSIQRKQMLAIMATSVVALLLACAGFIAYEIFSYRQELVSSLTSLSQMIGNNSTGALDFNDPKVAEDLLSSLRAQPDIVSACIYTKDGTPFARYLRSDVPRRFSLPKTEGNGHRFANGRLILFQGIRENGETIGSIYLESDLGRLTARLREYALIVVVMVVAAMLAAFVLSSQLQRWLSQPILLLARTAREVTDQKNYSLRAVKRSQDELGMLTDDFNAMLDQIQRQAAALQAANESLEKRVEDRTRELERSLSLLHSTIESTADGILVVDQQGRIATYNKKFASMWRIPETVIASGQDEKVISAVMEQLRDPDEFLSKVHGLYAHPEEPSFDVVEFKDGRTFERYSMPQRLGQEIVGRVWNFRDITERKQAEKKVETLHRQLLDASRQAGMAEVATNVLHNVGNVLNSVNVSASLVADQVRKSKSANLTKLATLIQEHQQDLAAFFTSDPKGAQVPGYLAGLATVLNQEQAVILKELQSLSANIDHIKEIVAMQQSYSKMSGVVETIPVEELVEDAVRMNNAALLRHDVQVCREYGEVPPIMVEKHKVLQILVNLIRNSKYALDEGGRPDKRLTLQVSKNGGDFVRVAVVDNGVGIPPQNLTRIFEHGFTTRKKGHGFGLHSGALTAKELGGTLTAHSDGPGKGATFVLELPVQAKERKHD
ncbi:MAG TPA: CHASE sensor domain-containing protein [Verrucomicrobiae bacterium]|nr:CHASE sensor domain-containing protein [Verrucomicrobiae bacterium]